MRSGVLCFYRIGICIFLKRDSELRRTSEEIFFLYTSNPSPKKLPYLRCLPYITNVTPRNATRHSRREVDIRFCFLFCQYFFQPPRPTGTPPISSTMSRGRGLKCHFISFKLLHCRHFLTPPSFGHLPYILLCKTQGRREVNTFLVFIFLTEDLYIALRHPVMLWDTAGEEVLKCHSNNEP